MAITDLCPCLDAVFGETPPAESLARLAAMGIRQFEFWDWRGRDVRALAHEASSRGMSVVAFSGNTFDEPLVDPGAHVRALGHLEQSLDIADRLGVRLLVTHLGYALPHRPRQEQWGAAVAGLRAAAAQAARAGVRLAVEPLNSAVDHPGYFLDTLEDADRLLEDVGHPSVRLLLDVYHMSMMHRDLVDRLPGVAPKIAHVHVADVPGRGEPGSGTILWTEIMEALEAVGYTGSIGVECWPTTAPEQALRRSAAVLGLSADHLRGKEVRRSPDSFP